MAALPPPSPAGHPGVPEDPGHPERPGHPGHPEFLAHPEGPGVAGTVDDAVTTPDWPGVRLHVVSGKGGTGKTSVACALALASAARGQRVLLIEVEGRQGLAQALGIPPLGTEETPVVDKDTVAVEEVHLGTRTVTDEETVNTEVRREEIDTDDDRRS